ncbi:NAD(P)/FAD-dependent oxidoreductase [Cupriavidus necator]
MHPIRRLPAIDGNPGWFETSPSRHTPLGKRLTGDTHFDFAIVGAGFTGVALARRLAELHPQASIALVEALEVGQGTSGRNAGFIIDVPHNVDGGDAGAEHDRQLYALNTTAIERLRRLRDQYGIDCAWHDAGKYMSAHEARHVGALERFAAALNAAGFPSEFIEGQGLARRLGTGYYRAAVYTPGNVLVNPAALVRGLAASLPESVTLFSSSPVLGCEHGAHHTLRFAHGSLRAERLTLTVGSFSEAFGQARNRVATLFTYASLTEPLTQAEAAEHFPEVRPWGTTSAHPAGTTVRFTPDRRLFVRNTFHYQPALRTREAHLHEARDQHRRSFEARFPALAGKAFAYTWGGLIGMTLNHHSVFRHEGDNLYAVAGCNGVGVAKGTYLGHYMAEYMSGLHSAELGFILANSQPTWIPPDPLRKVGATLRLRRELAGAGGEI